MMLLLCHSKYFATVAQHSLDDPPSLPPSHNHSIPLTTLPSLLLLCPRPVCLSLNFFLFCCSDGRCKIWRIQSEITEFKVNQIRARPTRSYTCTDFSSISYRSSHSPFYLSMQAVVPNRRLLPLPSLPSSTDTESCFGPEIFILNLGCGIVMTLIERGEQGSHGFETDRADLDSDGDSDNDNDDISNSNKLYSSAGEGEGNGNRKKYLWLPARSLLVLRGAARYNWSHGIAPRTTDKVDCTMHCTFMYCIALYCIV